MQQSNHNEAGAKMSKSEITKKVDVLILGAGVTGSVAASVLAKSGYQVSIVDKIGGSTGQSSGAIDVAYLPGHANESMGFIDFAKSIARTENHHPYSKIGEHHLQHINDALATLTELAHDVEFISRKDGRNLILATQIGSVKHTAMTQKTQAYDLNDLTDGDQLTIIGFSGLPSFETPMIARMLSWSLSQSLKKNIMVRPLDVKFNPPSGIWRSPIELALALDQKEHWEEFESQILTTIESESIQSGTFLLPPVLGRIHYKKLWELLNEKIGRPIYEMLAQPHSAPGLRLKDALTRGLLGNSVEIINGAAVSAMRENSHITKVILDVNSTQIEIKARKIILATGRFFSGGFEKQGLRREKVFGLPLWHEGKAIEDLHVATLTSKGIANDQPIFTAGLNVDEKSRPYDRQSELFALNLFAAGSSLGGYDSGGANSGLGLAAFTGYMSAFHTANALKG